jgi:hypothetical protein
LLGGVEHKGLVLTLKHDHPTTLLVLDFDKVVGTEFEKAVLTLKSSAWLEKSISGKGYHAFFEVPTQELLNRNLKNRYNSPVYGPLTELYYTGRFIAFTNNHVEGSELRVLSLKEIQEILGFEFPEKNSKVKQDVPLWQDHSSDALSYMAGANVLQNVPRGTCSTTGDIDISYEPTEDLSLDVFKWVAKVIGFCPDLEHLAMLFHQTTLATREEGKYADSGAGKFRRILPYILTEIDVKEKQIKAGTRSPFNEVQEEEVEALVGKEKQAMEEFRARYAKLLQDVYQCHGQVKRSVFDGVAYIFYQGERISIESEDVIRCIKDEIRVRNRFEHDPKKKLKSGEVESAVTAYRSSLKKELPITIKDWDGEDRMKHLSTLVNLGEEISAECFEYFLRDWLVRCVHKVMTGRGTNRMLVLQGGQGVGKDSFLGMLYGGWTGDYSREISAPGKNDGEDVLMEQVYNVAVASLRELDRFDPICLKRLIDNKTFSFRQKYAKNTVNHINRVSFVGSCNPKNPFRDETGNRRFLFFRIQGRPDTIHSAENYPYLPVAIKRDYDDQDQEYKDQVLAQAFSLWRGNGRTPLALDPMHEAMMEKLIASVTPEDNAVDLLEQFDIFFSELLKERENYGNYCRLIPRVELRENTRFKTFCTSVDMKMKDVEKELENSDRRSKESHPNLCAGSRFFHLPGEFTLEQRKLAKDWTDGKRFEKVEDNGADIPF